MSIKSKTAAAAVVLTAAGSLSAVATQFASAATPQCTQRAHTCVEIFSKKFGTPTSPGFVETVVRGIPAAGVPTILHRLSTSNPAEDLIPHTGTVSSFYADGMVSAAVNRHYGSENATQVEYAPYGVATGLCAAVARTAYQNEGLTLQPCRTPGTTVWIIDTADSPSTAPTYFPLVSASTRDFAHPFGMTFPGRADPAHTRFPQIKVRHLIGNPAHVPDGQLWGAVPAS